MNFAETVREILSRRRRCRAAHAREPVRSWRGRPSAISITSSSRPGRYVRHPVLLWEDWEVMVIGWESGQITPIHDHRGVLGGMASCRAPSSRSDSGPERAARSSPTRACAPRATSPRSDRPYCTASPAGARAPSRSTSTGRRSGTMGIWDATGQDIVMPRFSRWARKSSRAPCPVRERTSRWLSSAARTPSPVPPPRVADALDQRARRPRAGAAAASARSRGAPARGGTGGRPGRAGSAGRSRTRSAHGRRPEPPDFPEGAPTGRRPGRSACRARGTAERSARSPASAAARPAPRALRRSPSAPSAARAAAPAPRRGTRPRSQSDARAAAATAVTLDR